MKSIERGIKAEIGKRKEYDEKGISTIIVDTRVKQQFEEVKNVLNKTKTNEIDNAKIPPNEMNRRLSILQEWSQNMDRLKTSYDKTIHKTLMVKV